MRHHLVYNEGGLYIWSRWIKMSNDTRRINVTFPAQLLEELDSIVPAGKRSDVIVEATAAYLSRLRVLAALKETGGAWRDEDHPDLATPEDVSRWLDRLRAPWRRVPLLADRESGLAYGTSSDGEPVV